MPPKVKITAEKVADTAFALVRESGEGALNARSIAAALGCSTQPIFSNYSNMEALRAAVIERAEKLFYEYMRRETESGLYPAYKASGMAYIRFAKDEKELFRILYMRDRREESVPENDALFSAMTGTVARNTGLDPESSELFHLEIWAFVHGIATMHATNFLELDTELISRMLTDSYQGLRKRYGVE